MSVLDYIRQQRQAGASWTDTITHDHGTCLACGQLFHGRRLEMHDHLTTVPWFEVEGLA